MNTPGWFAEFFRDIFAALDSVGYWLLQGVYDVFFAVSNAEILSGNTMNDLYGRLQLIFGVFMVFKLSLTILNIIINPDNYKDKQKGAGSIVVRVAVMLIMLTLVIPIDIPNPDGNPLNEKINQNGILFGFLYQFQDSVITENVLGKLILGSNVGSSTDINSMSDMGGLMTLQVARAFMTPTLVNEDAEITDEDTLRANAACLDDLDNTIHYYEPTVKASYLADHINDTCDNEEAGGEVFVMQYTMLGGFIFSIIMSIIVLGFTVDVAVRAIKLAILRIIAPVPIITYVTPGAEKDGAFGNWVKTLTSTYLDLFIRLAVISFGAYVIVKLTEDGNLNIVTTSTNWFTTGLATIFVILGILVFMKQAPKFFKDMLGIKGDSSLFGGVGAALGGAALIGGLAGSIATNARASWGEGAEFRDKAQSKLGLVGRSALTGLGAIGSSFAGGIGGAFAGGNALMTSDKKVPSSVMAAMQKRNTLRSSHSTLPGRISSGAFDMFTGMSLAERDQQVLDLNKEAAEAAAKLKSVEEEEAIKFGDYGTYTLRNGVTGNFNYSDLQAAMQSKDTFGNFNYNGTTYNADMFGKNDLDEILKNQTERYTQGHSRAGVKAHQTYAGNGKIQSQKTKTDYAFRQAGGEAAKAYGDGSYGKLGFAIGKANDAVTSMSTTMKHVKHRANHNASKKG